MEVTDRNPKAIWKQEVIPVIYRRGYGQPLMIKLPYESDNRNWLQRDHRRKPKWNKRFTCWEIPQSWLDDIVELTLRRFSRVYVIQPSRVQEKCAPACWNAEGFECNCSCMGANHGFQNQSGRGE